MDPQAYLLRHGWSGPGTPLNPNRRPGTHGGLGLTKPLLVARRQGNEGVGKKTTKDPTNQWWLRGFEDALKGVGGEKPATAGAGAVRANALTSELYRFFVRGEVVPGTIGGSRDQGEGKGEKRKLGEGVGEEEGETREAKKARREEKRRRKGERAERKAARQVRREEKKVKKDEKEKRRAERAVRREQKQRKKARKAEEDYPTPVSMELDSAESSGRDEAALREAEEKMAKKESKKARKQESASSSSAEKSKSKSKSKESKESQD